MTFEIDELVDGIHDDRIVMVTIPPVSINRIKELTLRRVEATNDTSFTRRKRIFSAVILAAILTAFLVTAAAVDMVSNHFLGTKEIEYPVSADGQILPPETPSLGIEFSAASITATGMELSCTHTDGDYMGHLIAEDHYYIEVQTVSGWNTVPPVGSVPERLWSGTELCKNETYTWVLDWSSIYGELPPGTYRLRQPVWELCNKSIGQYFEYCIEFTIMGVDI